MLEGCPSRGTEGIGRREPLSTSKSQLCLAQWPVGMVAACMPFLAAKHRSKNINKTLHLTAYLLNKKGYGTVYYDI